MVTTPVDINQVKALAATGHFRSIALWLNYPLVPQAIYAHVQADRTPGYLTILLEFERTPKKESLIRLVCNRICQLKSKQIRGISVVGRLVGTNQPLWQQRIRLTTPKRKNQPKHPRPQGHSPQGHRPQTTTAPVPPIGETTPPRVLRKEEHPLTIQPPDQAVEEKTETITVTAYSSTFEAVPTTLIPKPSDHTEGRRRPNHTAAPAPVVQIRPTHINSNQSPSQRRINRRLTPKSIIEQQFNYARAIVVTGSAAAAFILGCVTEVMMTQSSQVAQETAPTPYDGGWRTLSEVETQDIAYRSATRSPSISTALEPVAVMPHPPSSDPQDPTVTLVFGGEVPVGEVPLQTPDAISQVLGELDLYREADVAMIGLGNSLASADTSLQEEYFERSRPDATDALNQGGIDIVGLTEDRIMDFGHQGLAETLEALDSAGIYRVGAGRDHQEARRPEVLEVKGQRIAYLSYAPSTAAAATANQAGINRPAKEGIIEDIAALRQAVDWIVVNYRWHGELATAPSTQQINLSRSAIDAGADLVVGYHPNQLQGAELYNSRPIVYALGDFVFQDDPLEDHHTATLRVSLRQKQMKVEFLPISVKAARPQAATGETAQAILKQIRQASAALPSPLQFPTILEAPLKAEPLLQPEKATAPIKTLGELESTQLEPTQLESEQDYFDNEQLYGRPTIPNAPPGFINSVEADGFQTEGVEIDSVPTNNFQTDTFESNTVEPESFEIDSVPRDSTQTDTSETDSVEGNTVETNSLEPSYLNNSEFIPNDTSNSNDELLPYPINNEPPSPDLDTITTPDKPDLQADEEPGTKAIDSEQPDENRLIDHQTLPEYEGLEDWGEKSSPHKEFNPIQEHVNSVELSDDAWDTSPEATGRENTQHPPEPSPGAISPHDEPLVGPLSQKSSELTTNDIASNGPVS